MNMNRRKFIKYFIIAAVILLIILLLHLLGGNLIAMIKNHMSL